VIERSTAAAFLRARARLVEASDHNPTAKIMLPAGPASAGEIKLALSNLNLIHNALLKGGKYDCRS
jgi:hypothetical protein